MYGDMWYTISERCMVASGTLRKEVTMFQIDSLSDKPIYKQIVDQIKSMISKNLLQEGDKLPSVREFSKMLGVNVSTIQKAFQQLESEKIITTIVGRGTFITNNFDNIIPNYELIDSIIEDLVREVKIRGISEEDLLEKINKKFSKKIVLNNVSFSVSTGEIVALVGRNGSGKTTLLKILSGIYSQDSGKIRIEDVDNKNIKKQLIYIPDRFDYFKNSKIKKVGEFYKLAYENFDEKYFKTELEKIKLSQTSRLSELSKGQLAIFSLILGISCRTKFIFLDEPLDGIDVINTKMIVDYILDAQGDGIGLLISSHQLNSLENISDKVVYLDEGIGVSEEINKDEYSKYQLVYQEKIPDELRRNTNVKIISNIGRVYVVIIRGSYDSTHDIIQDKDLLQYDKLPIALEDIFLLNSKGEDENV